MLPHRRWLLFACLVVVGGSLAATGAYAYRMNSEGYRHKTERLLAAFLELPCEIGEIKPLTFSSREFDRVAIWLADRRAQVFQCQRAVWHELSGIPDPPDQLDLYDGTLSISTDDWQREDYTRVLKSSLGHDFEAIDLGSARLHRFGVQIRHRGVDLTVGGASGEVDFAVGREGSAHLSATTLNGYETTEPVQVSARFVPKDGVQIREVVLTVPDMPLSAVGVDSLLHTRTTQGRFAGRIEYSEPDGRPELRLAGVLHDAALKELTTGLPTGPISGRLDVAIDRARFSNRVVTHLVGRGEINGINLADFRALLAQPTLDGRADLRFLAVDLASGHVNRLVLDGAIRDLPLELLSTMMGKGRVTGTLSVTINALRVRNDVIEWADVEVEAVPPPDSAAGTIDRSVLLTGLTAIFDVKLPDAFPESILPGRIDYARFGMRLRIRDNKLSVLGTHGSRGNTILTIRVLGQDLAVIHSLRAPIDLTPHLAAMRERMQQQDPEQLRDWLDQHRPK